MTQTPMSYMTPSGIPCYAVETDGEWTVGNSTYAVERAGASYELAAAAFERALLERAAELAAGLEHLAVMASDVSRAAGNADTPLRPVESATEGRCLFCGRMRWAVRTLLAADNGATICNVCVEVAVPQIGVAGGLVEGPFGR